MSFGPVPTHLTLLRLLPTTPPLTKVRFLGCVESYSTQTGCLHLKHPPSTTTALVDISHVETRKEDLEGGSWVNVIGWLQEGVGESASTAGKESASLAVGKGKENMSIGGKQKRGGRNRTVSVQALLMWNAGAIDIKAYESGVRARMEVDRLQNKENRGYDQEKEGIWI